MELIEMEEKEKNLNQGLVIVYTGDGKGKTTASIGLGVRAIGYNWNVCMIQFIKGSWKYGELESIKRLTPKFEIIPAGKGFVNILGDSKPFKLHKQIAHEAIELSIEKITSDKYKIIILDEINYALNLKLINLKDILRLIKIKPKGLTLVITGDKAHKRVIDSADLVTEMKNIKHPYQKKNLAIKGLDF